MTAADLSDELTRQRCITVLADWQRRALADAITAARQALDEYHEGREP